MKFINQKSLFKIIGASALATCMLATSLFAFIPNSTQAETLNSNQSLSNIQSNTTTTESTGLITPRADDPVLFTTENGLEIKAGTALTGNLAGFPYFTTNDGTTDYYWVIIGVAPNLANLFSTAQDGYTIGMWEDKQTTLSEYYKANIKDNISAAGSIVNASNAVAGVVQDGTYSATYSKTPRSNEEIPNSCVLVLSQNALMSGPYNIVEDTAIFHNSTIQNVMHSWYENGVYGLKEIKNAIVNMSIATKDNLGSSSTKINTNIYHLFPLAYDQESSFCWSDYLADTEVMPSETNVTVWIRGTPTGQTANYQMYYYKYSSVSIGRNSSWVGNGVPQYRPSFVIQI